MERHSQCFQEAKAKGEAGSIGQEDRRSVVLTTVVPFGMGFEGSIGVQ